MRAKFGDFLTHIKKAKEQARVGSERATKAETQLSEAVVKVTEAEKRANNAAVNLELFDSTIRMVCHWCLSLQLA